MGDGELIGYVARFLAAPFVSRQFNNSSTPARNTGYLIFAGL
jgi:hypothetical protein